MNDNNLFPNNNPSTEESEPLTPPVTESFPEEGDIPAFHPDSQLPPDSSAAAVPKPIDEEPAPVPPAVPRPPHPPVTDPYGRPYGAPRMPEGNVPPYGNPLPRDPSQQPPRYGYPPQQGYAPQGYAPRQGQYPQNPGYGGNPNYTPLNRGYGSVPPTQPPYASPQSSNPDPKKKPKKKKKSNWLLVLLIVGCILIGSVSGVIISGLMGRQSSQETVAPPQPTNTPDKELPTESTTAPTVATEPRETQPLATASGEQMTLNQIYTTNVPAIVGISNEKTQSMFGQTSTASSAGSGFIISSDGEILTNYHVVEGAEKLVVTLYDGREFPATLVGYEAESDVALIKIDGENLPVCAIGNSDQVYVGEQVAAIGNPMGELTYTMTVGYVSAMDRFVNTDGTPISMIQVDAAINPGNSGGPVFNLYGEVIGIATAKYSGTISGGATLEGLGFAIPINDIVEILNDLRINGKVPDRAYMGVMVSMLPLDEATYGIDHGVYVQSVEPDGSAYKAGVQAEDIILKIGDVELNAYENLQQTLRKYRAGDETTITVYRNGETITLPIVFDAKPETTPAATEPPTQSDPNAPTEPVPTDPEASENPWETFPWDEFPWNEFPWEEFGG